MCRQGVELGRVAHPGEDILPDGTDDLGTLRRDEPPKFNGFRGAFDLLPG
jgi:hypothetical protein